MSASHAIRQVRIDVPLRATCAYFFVNSWQAKWHPWWGALYEHLVQLAPAPLSWQHEPVQGVYVARPKLTEEQKRPSLVFFEALRHGRLKSTERSAELSS